MSDEKAHGVVDHKHIKRKSDYLFRISMKGLVRNKQGLVLVVKETGRTWWDLPGGGMDHNESIKEAITRELNEEVNLIGDFTYRVIAIEEPAFLEHAKVWQIRLVFEVTPVSMVFKPGEDGDEVIFIDPATLKNSDKLAEQKVYEYSQLVCEK
jgi:8-oxo-dGTP pyrophosphatase MutT (NUDIX family)